MAAPEAVRAVEWLRARHWDDKTMPTSLAIQKVAPREAFYTQRLAMVEDGSWALKDILSHTSFRLGVAPMPAGPARRATLATTDGFGIFAGTKYPDAAWELMKFLISKEYGRAMARTNFLQPARASLVEEWIGFIRAEYPAQTEGMDLAAFADGHLQGYSVTAEVFANMTGVRTATDAAWEEIITLGQAPTEQRLVQACEAITAIQREAGGQEPGAILAGPADCPGGCS
jgi:multiple sugar transport system substrate-binding protein